jgi:hypothetical protein
LTQLSGCRLAPAGGKELFQMLAQLGIILQRLAQHLRYRLARQVIFRWTQPTDGNDRIGTRKRTAQRSHDPLPIIPNRGAPKHLHPNRCQLA